MARLFAVLSGEHETLPLSEVKAILKAEKVGFKFLDFQPCLLRFEASIEALEKIFQRAAYCRICGIELFECDASAEEILRFGGEIAYEELVRPGETFAVRIRRICGAEKLPESLELERRLGGIIWQRVEGLKVDLKSPEKLFVGLITKGGRFIFGLSWRGFIERKFSERAPSKKPFFHPSSLKPKLARCMVNLSRVSAGKLLYDPFCGTGTILIEASLMGFEAVGGDLQRRMAKGAKINLKHYNAELADVLVADALSPPLREIGAIATDPPYKRSATTFGKPLTELFEGFLSAAAGILRRDGFICMASPMEISALAEDLGFKVVEEHRLYVHKSLTRHILVLKLK